MKKTICIALAAMMLAGTAGCQKKSEVGKLSAEKPSLKVLNIYMSEDYSKAALSNELYEKTGYQVTYDMLPRDKAEDKLNLVMSANESYDYIVVDGSMRDRFFYYAQNGALMQLDDLIEKYGENMKRVMSEQTFEGMKVGGKLYGIGTANVSVSENGTINSMLAIRSDIKEKYSLNNIETLDDFTKALKKIKQGEKGIIPLTLSATLDTAGIAGAFGIPNAWNDVGGKLVNKVEDPRFKSYLAYMKSLYQEGLLDSEVPTNKNATVEEKFTSGKAAVAPIAWTKMPNVSTALAKNLPNTKISFVNPPKGSNGEFGIGSTVGGYDRITFIPKNAKNAEHSIAYMDMKLEDELFKFIAIGQEGVHHEVKDGEYYPIAPKFFEDRGNANNFFNGINEKEYPKYWLARVRKDPNLFDAFKNMNLQNPQNRIPNVIGYAPILEKFSKYNQMLAQKTEDFALKVIVGETPIEKMDEYITEWKAKGGDEMTAELNNWYGSFKK